MRPEPLFNGLRARWFVANQLPPAVMLELVRESNAAGTEHGSVFFDYDNFGDYARSYERDFAALRDALARVRIEHLTVAQVIALGCACALAKVDFRLENFTASPAGSAVIEGQINGQSLACLPDGHIQDR